jgi:hypothetical protein
MQILNWVYADQNTNIERGSFLFGGTHVGNKVQRKKESQTMSSQPLPDVVRIIVVPIIVGAIGTIVGTFITWVVERKKMREIIFEAQMKMATETCRKVVQITDEVSTAMMRTPSAWDVAWRRARSKEQEAHWTIESPADALQQQDLKTWEAYLAKMREWQCQELTLETELKAAFGATNGEAILFSEIAERVDFAASKLWNIYYVKKNMQLQKERSFSIVKTERLPESYFTSKSESTPASLNYNLVGRAEEDSLTNRNNGDIVSNGHEVGWTREDQIQNGKEMFELFREIRDKIKLLSGIMAICIAMHNVGTLRPGGIGQDCDPHDMGGGVKLMTLKETPVLSERNRQKKQV